MAKINTAGTIEFIENQLRSSLDSGKKEFWSQALKEAKRFEAMSEEQVKQESRQADKDLVLALWREKILDLSPEEREGEIRKERAKADKEWEEVIAGLGTQLIEGDNKRRQAEAEAEKKIIAKDSEELIENFKSFLGQKDLASLGVVMKRLALQGKFGELLNTYGYASDSIGAGEFANEILIGARIVAGEQALENLFYQQRVYAIFSEIGALAEGQNIWPLAFLVGRKGRAWYWLEEREHLLAVRHRIEKISAGEAVRTFGPRAYLREVPLSEENPALGVYTELAEEGKIILEIFGHDFLSYVANKEFNPLSAAALAEVADELEMAGILPALIAEIKSFGKN